MLPPRTAQRMTGGRSTRSTSPCPIRPPLQSLTPWHRYRQEHPAFDRPRRPGDNRFAGKIARGRIAARLANVPRCLIGIEAGMATHYVARELGALGHDVKQVPPAYSKPFRQGHKNDFRDAHAIAEAVQRPSLRSGGGGCDLRRRSTRRSSWGSATGSDRSAVSIKRWMHSRPGSVGGKSTRVQPARASTLACGTDN